MQSSIGTTRRENSLIMMGPLNLKDFVFVRFECMQFQFQIPKIPKCNRLKRLSFDKLIFSSDQIQTLSADPVARMYSENGLNDKQLTSAECASTTCDGFVKFDERVSQLNMKRNVVPHINNSFSSNENLHH